MAQLAATASDVEVSGDVARAIVKGMHAIGKRFRHALAEHGLDNPDPDCWYSLDALLDVFETLSDNVGPFVISGIGARVADDAKFPAEVDSVEEALTYVDTLLRSSHRGADFGSYVFNKMGKDSGRIVSTTQYPCDFDRAFVEAVARRFRPKQSWNVTVQHEESTACRKRGGDCCTYVVKW
jgi:hypothetical protein